MYDKGSCEGFKCSTSQRCIMKRGMPKCVCAPSCKAPPKKLNKNYNHIRVEYMQQKTKNLERQTNNERHKRRHKIEMQNDAPAHLTIPNNKTHTDIKTSTNYLSFKKKIQSNKSPSSSLTSPSHQNSNFSTSNDVNIDDREMFKDFVEYRIRSGSWNKRNIPKTTTTSNDFTDRNHKIVRVCLVFSIS